MKIQLTFILLLILLNGTAQSLISTAGKDGTVGNYTFSWSLGEVVTATGTAGNVIATQGYQQPFIINSNNIVPTDYSISNTTVSSGSEDCFNATITITVAGDGNDVIIESGAMSDFIAGQTIRFLPGFHAQAGSYAHGYITETGDYCMESTQAIVAAETNTKEALIVSAEEGILQPRKMIVYPNPNSGEFTVEFRNFEGETRVMLFNSIGQMVLDETTTEPEIRMNVPNWNSGMYLIKAVNNNQRFSAKIIVR